MSGAAHNDTVNFLIEELQELGDYYTVERQPWPSFVQMNGTAYFFADSVYYQPGLMEYSPSVNTTVPMLDSTYYVESLSTSELSNIRAYLNFDMIASPDYIYAIYDGDGSAFNMTGLAGSAEIEHFFEAWFSDNGLNSTATVFYGRSDYQAFIGNGIPAGGTFTGAEEIKTEAAMFGGEAGVATDVNYHQAGDTVANLNLTAFEVNTKAIAVAVAMYAKSFESLPPKSSFFARVCF